MPHHPRKSHTRTLILCLLGLTWGVGLTIIAVPAYRILCQHFGIPVPSVLVGQTNEPRGATTTSATSSRVITVRYTANVNGGVPIHFNPMVYSQKVKLGEPVLTAYQAKNVSSKPFDGVAVHMLFAMGGEQGIDVSSYVNLQQCFCFAQEHYPAGEDTRLPLSFTISPNLPAGIHTITFSYTLFEALPGDTRIKKTPYNTVTPTTVS